jgi:hypothetical protein
MLRKLALPGVVLLLGVSLAGATTLVKMNFSDLAREADMIVAGTVTEINGEWDPSLTFIRSNVTLDVQQSLRGQAPDTITLRNPGGWVGGEGQIAAGTAEFEVGEQVVLFLTTWEEDGAPKVLGYVQGKSRVVQDAQGRDRLMGGSADGRTLASVVRELREGPSANVPLRPAN